MNWSYWSQTKSTVSFHPEYHLWWKVTLSTKNLRYRPSFTLHWRTAATHPTIEVHITRCSMYTYVHIYIYCTYICRFPYTYPTSEWKASKDFGYEPMHLALEFLCICTGTSKDVALWPCKVKKPKLKSTSKRLFKINVGYFLRAKRTYPDLSNLKIQMIQPSWEGNASIPEVPQRSCSNGAVAWARGSKSQKWNFPTLPWWHLTWWRITKN